MARRVTRDRARAITALAGVASVTACAAACSLAIDTDGLVGGEAADAQADSTVGATDSAIATDAPVVAEEAAATDATTDDALAETDAAFDSSDGGDGADWSSLPAYAQAVLAANPIAYWRFEEPAAIGSLAYSTVGGHLYDGIYGAATTRGAPGALGPDGGNAIRQVQLGGGGGVTMGDLFGLANGSPMSFEFLFCPSSVPQVQNMGVPELFGGGNSSFPYLLAYDRTGATAAPQVVLEIPSQNVYDRVASPPYGSWMHMVVTFDGTNARMYENSMEVGLTGFAPDAGDAAARTFSVGVDSDGFNEFSGSIDEFAVYGTVLPAETIDAHYELVLAVQGDAGCGVVDAGTAHDL